MTISGVLRGVRVLDLSTIVAGPAASMVLADLGADIIKVERVGSGEDGRGMGPHRGPWGAYFTALNRGKRSIAVDIRKPAGRETVLRIAATCDVLLENFRGGKAAELGFDEPSVRARRADIIYASLSAYGPGGPDYARPGYDGILQARTGIMSITGTGDDAPIRSGVSILDMGTGVWMALGVVAALLERQRSGKRPARGCVAVSDRRDAHVVSPVVPAIRGGESAAAGLASILPSLLTAHTRPPTGH